MGIKHLILATILTACVGLLQWSHIWKMESQIVELESVKEKMSWQTSSNTYQACQVSEPSYTAEMDVSWHSWQPTGKAAGVIPVALLELAEEHNISPVYASAVFILETGWGESNNWINKHNPAGITCAKKYCTYDNAKEGLQRMFELMENYYLNGLTTVEQQRTMWSESEDTEKIVELMNQLLERK